ncbi:MAG: hypothetical protein AB2L20_08755 [Mangrovibacterium sp.]
MGKHLLIVLFMFCAITVFSQMAPFVQLSGSGVTTYAPVNGFSFSHHSNVAMNISSLTVKWDLRTLMGEPVIDGVFKWEAGARTPSDYLDYCDCVLLECSPKKSVGYMVYIKITPIVPKSGEGYGYNAPGSPSWQNVFCARNGEPMTTKVPSFNGNTAKDIWKSGFYVTGVVLIRQGGNDGFLEADASKQQADYEKQKVVEEQSKNKFKALQHPFTLTANNNDTVYSSSFRLFKEIDPYFSKAVFIIISINRQTNLGDVAGSPEEVLMLSEGWNVVSYYIRSSGFALRDSIRVFLKKQEEKVLLSDDFNDGIMDDRWIVSGYVSDYVYVTESNGFVLIKQGGERTRTYLKSRPLIINPDKKLIIEFKSTFRKDIYCTDAWLYINNFSMQCKKKCDVPEQIKVVCDLKNGLTQRFVDNEEIYRRENTSIALDEGKIQIGFSCSQFEKWELDDVMVYQE